MAKGKTNLRIKAKLNQKGGTVNPEVSINTSDNTVLIIIVLFVLAIAAMFVYFKYFDKPVIIIQQTAAPEQAQTKEVLEVVQQVPVKSDTVQYLVDKEQERLINPLLPPERSYVLTNGAGIPVYKNSINVPTRGFTGAFQQIGLLYKKDPSGDTNSEGNILPLFGRPTNTNRDKWYYYTTSDKFHSLKIPLKIKGRLCNDEWGCNELYDDDTVEVGPYNGQFKVQIYGYDSPKYLPMTW
jgi:hypothetical protein